MSKQWKILHSNEVLNHTHKKLIKESKEKLREELRERRIDAREMTMGVDEFFKSGRVYDGR